MKLLKKTVKITIGCIATTGMIGLAILLVGTISAADRAAMALLAAPAIISGIIGCLHLAGWAFSLNQERNSFGNLYISYVGIGRRMSLTDARANGRADALAGRTKRFLIHQRPDVQEAYGRAYDAENQDLKKWHHKHKGFTECA